MKKISIITLGCKVNQYESDSLSSLLEESGFEVVNKIEPSDYFIVNTCAVTNEAEKKSRMIISKIRKSSKNSKIFVCGCASQKNKENFNLPNVFSIGTIKKDEILKFINNDAFDKNFNINNNELTYHEMYFAKNQKTRAYIKIQDGCNNFCSYCIIPYLRGRERSRQIESIKKELDCLVKYYNEIIFVGINLSNYGKDFKDNTSLIDVIKLASQYKNTRFRLSSLEINIVSDSLLTEMKNSKNICDHFHLSLQSASNNVLKSMNRKYTIEEYKEKVNLIRKFFPNAGITTDIIVGYPTETEEDFNEGLKNIEDIKFSDIHIFPFSKRDGTVASKLKQLNGTIVKERELKLQKLKENLKNNFLNSQIGKIYEIITEIKTDKYYDGLSSNYIRCYFDAENIKPNTKLKVKLKSLYKDGVFCEIV